MNPYSKLSIDLEVARGLTQAEDAAVNQVFRCAEWANQLLESGDMTDPRLLDEVRKCAGKVMAYQEKVRDSVEDVKAQCAGAYQHGFDAGMRAHYEQSAPASEVTTPVDMVNYGLAREAQADSDPSALQRVLQEEINKAPDVGVPSPEAFAQMAAQGFAMQQSAVAAGE